VAPKGDVSPRAAPYVRAGGISVRLLRGDWHLSRRAASGLTRCGDGVARVARLVVGPILLASAL